METPKQLVPGITYQWEDLLLSAELEEAEGDKGAVLYFDPSRNPVHEKRSKIASEFE